MELFEVANQGTQNRTRLEDCWNGRIESKNHRIIFCCSKKYLGIDARIQTLHTGGLYTFVVLVKRIYLVVISLSVIHFLRFTVLDSSLSQNTEHVSNIWKVQDKKYFKCMGQSLVFGWSFVTCQYICRMAVKCDYFNLVCYKRPEIKSRLKM